MCTSMVKVWFMFVPSCFNLLLRTFLFQTCLVACLFPFPHHPDKVDLRKPRLIEPSLEMPYF